LDPLGVGPIIWQHSLEGEEQDLEGDLDPDRVTPEVIDDILSRELGKGYTDVTLEHTDSQPLNPPVITIEQFHSPPVRGPNSVDAVRRLAGEGMSTSGMLF
jgi:hypothetical protein